MKSISFKFIWIIMLLFCITLTGCQDNGLNDDIYYIVSFDPTNDEAVIEVSVLENTKVLKPETPPEKIGYIFVNWYKDFDGTLPYDFDTVVTTNITLYAKWRKTIGSSLSYNYSIHSSFELALFEVDQHSIMQTDVDILVNDGYVSMSSTSLKGYTVGEHELEFLVDDEAIYVTLNIIDEAKPYIINKHNLDNKSEMDTVLHLEMFEYMFLSLSHNDMTTADYTFVDGTLVIDATYLDAVMIEGYDVIMVLQYRLDNTYGSIFVTIKNND